jgi:hypothetical protein
MRTPAKGLILVVLVFLIGNVVYAQSMSPTKPDWPAYALSVLVGFGTGQFYLGSNGTCFLISDTASLVSLGGGLLLFYYVSVNYSQSGYLGYRVATIGLAGAGAIAYLISRSWQFIDTVRIAKHGHEQETSMVVKPEICTDSGKLSFQISINL